jgi:3-ketosteroid 9alpha-monooxygenase subunit B
MAAAERAGRVARIRDHGGDTRSLFLALPGGERLAFVPGQFISCRLPGGDTVLTRPYSIASDPEDAELEVCLNRVPGGPGSAYLLGLPVGASVAFTGPWGTCTLERAPDTAAVFVADGTAMAPIRPMLRRALATQRGHRIDLLHATAPGAPALWQDEWDALLRLHPRFGVTHVPREALAAEVRRRWVDADQDRTRRFWICGVGPIVTELRDLVRHAGYERRAVRYEKW